MKHLQTKTLNLQRNFFGVVEHFCHCSKFIIDSFNNALFPAKALVRRKGMKQIQKMEMYKGKKQIHW